MENLLVVVSFVPVKGLDANTSGFCGANESTFGDEYLYNKYVHDNRANIKKKKTS